MWLVKGASPIQAHLHLRWQLRWVRDADGTGQDARPDACGIDYGRGQPVHVHEDDPAVLEAVAQMFYEMVGNPERTSMQARPRRCCRCIKARSDRGATARQQTESDQMVSDEEARRAPVHRQGERRHGFNNEENRFEFYGAMERFLAKHLR
jgi:hypothetical protein